jgi:hypothetical protein
MFVLLLYNWSKPLLGKLLCRFGNTFGQLFGAKFLVFCPGTKSGRPGPESADNEVIQTVPEGSEVHSDVRQDRQHTRMASDSESGRKIVCTRDPSVGPLRAKGAQHGPNLPRVSRGLSTQNRRLSMHGISNVGNIEERTILDVC